MLWDWGHFWPKKALQLSLLSVRLRMYDSNLYRRPHVMQRPLLKSQNFWVSSAEYYIGVLSLGRGHNIVRLDTHVPESLRLAARLQTSWPGQWLHYLTAVVSICEYTVSNKRGLPCHCHDCGQSWGQLPPLPPPPQFLLLWIGFEWLWSCLRTRVPPYLHMRA